MPIWIRTPHRSVSPKITGLQNTHLLAIEVQQIEAASKFVPNTCRGVSQPAGDIAHDALGLDRTPPPPESGFRPTSQFVHGQMHEIEPVWEKARIVKIHEKESFWRIG